MGSLLNEAAMDTVYFYSIDFAKLIIRYGNLLYCHHVYVINKKRLRQIVRMGMQMIGLSFAYPFYWYFMNHELLI
jgi:hypothetical protein